MFISRIVSSFVLISLLAASAWASTIAGTATDPAGGPVADAAVTLQNLATGAQLVTQADAEGRFRFEGLAVGIYRVAVDRHGFSEEARTVSIADPAETLELRFILRPGGLTSQVTVTATRSERDAQLVPLRTDTLDERALLPLNPVSTGDALVQAPSVTPVSSGPYLLRPRLRGLDSTRLLILVDGERLNNARTATDRAGTEVGLVDLGSVSSMEVVSGSGSVLYGTDALSGTINIITNQPELADSLRFTYGFDGYYSSNEDGRRGTVTLGARTPRFAVQFIGSLEDYGAYKAGADATEENTFPYYEQGILTQEDTIDDNFGFDFNAFPDPFNAPFVRAGRTVPVSASKGNSINAAGLFAITDTQTLRVKYIRRRVDDIGFPDFEQPYFFQRVTLPYSDFDRVSARYEARAIKPWFTNLQVSGYFQDQKRLLRNDFPVQFPVPSPRFFPINVFRLNIVSDTQQHVQTPGVDVQGTFLAGRKHVITAGATIYQDRSEDTRVSTTETTIIGNVSLGPRGPQPNVFDTPVVLGPPETTTPVRVPDASFRNIGFFVQDEWELHERLRLVLGLRADSYRVRTDATPGYDVAPLISGAEPPIDPDAIPSAAGDTVSRGAMTGDVGVVFRVNEATNIIGHYGRSYRHPNLEELLFAGPATVGTIVPNLLVEPEKGHNVDVGVRVRTNRYAASVTYFNNTFDGFISTEITGTSSVGPISQAINFADVRIQGVEADGQVPVVFRRGVVTLFGNVAFTRGTVLEGANPFTGESLAGTPQDNITPFKTVFGVRFTDVTDRYWVEYGARAQAEVDRVATTLIESPYLIAQDLLSLDGFFLQRIAGGVNFETGAGRLGLVLAVENLTDRFYREQFQFAPARGRTFTVGINVKGI